MARGRAFRASPAGATPKRQHRGEGASQGTPDLARALEDAEAALRHLAATDGARLPAARPGGGRVDHGA